MHSSLNQDRLSCSTDEKRDSSLADPLLQNENEAMDQVVDTRITRVTIDQQIDYAQADLNELFIYQRRSRKLFFAALLFFIICLTVTSYFCDEEPGPLEIGPNRKTLFFFLALASGIGSLFTGCLSFICCRENEGGFFARSLRNNPTFEEKITTALDITRSIGIEIKDATNPYHLNVGIQKARKEINQRHNQRLAFLSGSHSRLGEHSAVRTLFNGLGGGKGPATTRHAICENIFELAGINLEVNALT